MNHNIERLAQDHRRTQELATALEGLQCLYFDRARVQTNMLFLQSPQMPALADYLAQRGIAITAIGQNARIVLHMQVDDLALQQIVKSIRAFYSSR